LILTAKFLSLYVEESEWESESEILERSELGVGNFGKVGVEVGYFTSNPTTLILPMNDLDNLFRNNMESLTKFKS